MVNAASRRTTSVWTRIICPTILATSATRAEEPIRPAGPWRKNGRDPKSVVVKIARARATLPIGLPDTQHVSEDRLWSLPPRQALHLSRRDHLTNPSYGTVPSHIRCRTSRGQRLAPQTLIAAIASAWRQGARCGRPQRFLSHCERARKSRLHSKRYTRGLLSTFAQLPPVEVTSRLLVPRTEFPYEVHHVGEEKRLGSIGSIAGPTHTAGSSGAIRRVRLRKESRRAPQRRRNAGHARADNHSNLFAAENPRRLANARERCGSVTAL